MRAITCEIVQMVLLFTKKATFVLHILVQILAKLPVRQQQLKSATLHYYSV